MLDFFVNPSNGNIFRSQSEALSSAYRARGFKQFVSHSAAQDFADGLAKPCEPVKEEPKAPEITPQDAVIAEMSQARRESALPRRKRKLVK